MYAAIISFRYCCPVSFARFAMECSKKIDSFGPLISIPLISTSAIGFYTCWTYRPLANTGAVSHSDTEKMLKVSLKQDLLEIMGYRIFS